MLTITTIKSGIREKEEYYTQDESLEQDHQLGLETFGVNPKLTQAIWSGQGAEELGLSGPVRQEDFKNLFYGFKPNSEETIRRKNAHHIERLGDDLTFSAPKSVSIAFHLGNDLRIFDAHTESVKEVLDEVEARYAQTRISVGGNQEIVNSHNLTVALIPHHTSRDGDMQLHTHAFVMNGTKGPDDKWRSLYHDAMSHSQWLGNLYRQKLANKLQSIGYKLHETPDGFELAGISQQQMQGFSKRSQEIIRSIQKRGLEVTPANRDVATLTTRNAKHITQTLKAFQTQWKAEAIKMGIKIPQPTALEPSQHLDNGSPKEVLDSAITNLEQTKVSFTREDIYRNAFSSIQRFDVDELDRQIDKHQGLILTAQGTLTTTVALSNEAHLRNQWDEGQQTVSFLSNNFDGEIEQLNPGQIEALRRVLASTDSYQIVQGIRFKPFIGELFDQLADSNISVEIFSSTTTGAINLQKGYDLNAQPVDSISDGSDGETGSTDSNLLWIIDEAEKLDLWQTQQLLQRANSAQARLILIGGNNSDIESGSPLQSLMDYGATTHSLKEIIKAIKTDIQQAASLISEGHRSAAVELLNNNGYVHELEGEAHIQAIASEYLALSPSEQAQTLIATESDSDKDEITKTIRNQLQASGKLGEPVKITQLIPKSLNLEKRQEAGNYDKGDYLRLKRDYKSTPLKKDKLYQVIDSTEDNLLVSSPGGRLYNFNPSQYKAIEVFESNSLYIAAGDRISASANDKPNGLSSKKQFIVKSISDENMIISDNKDNQQTISLSQPLPIERIDHGFPSSSKATRVILSTNNVDSSQDFLLSKISQFTKHVSLYVPNLSQFKAWLKGFEQSLKQEQSDSHTAHNPDSASVTPEITKTPDHQEQNKAATITNITTNTSQVQTVQSNAVTIDYQTEYNKLAFEVRSQFRNISPERLDVEIYLKARNSGQDANKILNASNHNLNTNNNHSYGQAIALVADIYQRLSKNNSPNLEMMTSKLVQKEFIGLNMNEEDKYKLQMQVNQPQIKL